jgi:hypothetical protein
MVAILLYMERRLDVELIGPCSITGAVVNVDDTIATIEDSGRVGFHRVRGVEIEAPGIFAITVRGGARYTSSDCWLVYIKTH